MRDELRTKDLCVDGVIWRSGLVGRWIVKRMVWLVG